ncbi:MAG: type III secretion system outer membrane ring subunit SctC, partial [Burkholderiaceae bacterium]|nr:type III secretion system outer membrane ring subunit SctC [Burkholderiaceae bacterium]
SYGFVWYYNGAVLHIAAAKGIRSTLVKMSSARVEQLRESLMRMKLEEPRFPIVYDLVENTALVAGPQEYVDVVRELAAHLEVRGDRNGRAQTRIFALRNAWATDRMLDGQSQPGVASLLQAIYQDRSAGAAGSDALSRSTQRMVSGESATQSRTAPQLGPLPADGAGGGLLSSSRGSGLPTLGGTMGAAGTSAFARTMEGAAMSSSSNGLVGMAAGGGADVRSQKDENLPVIVADAGSNSIIVRDLPERMPLHERFIRTLDARPPTVEIEVYILDVEDGALHELGIDWQYQGRRVGATINTNPAAAASGAVTGGVLTAVIGNSAQQLLARVAALETAGRASVSARPKVATLSNVPAVMDSQETFHVKVGGYQSTQLYNVSSGLSMRVVPMVAPVSMDAPDDARQIKLDVRLQDGQVNYDKIVDSLPVVIKSEITTQALVNEGESLLLAGYSTERQKNGTTGIPLLSGLPVVGSLFRYTSSETKRRERMFLISPRVLDTEPKPAAGLAETVPAAQ